MRRLSSKGESFLQKYDDEKDEMDHDHYERQEEEAEEGNVSIYRNSLEDVRNSYYRKTSESRTVPLPEPPNSYTVEFCKESIPTVNQNRPPEIK